jgi:hypothetical protein
MATERDVKLGREGSGPPVDPVTNEVIRSLKTALIYCDCIKDILDIALDVDQFQRPYPKPEVRDVRRKIETCEAMLREIIG